MTFDTQVAKIINQMHDSYPYLAQLGYGLSYPSAIYLQTQVQKQTGVKLQILLAMLNPQSPLIYQLERNILLYRRSSNTNKTFSKFDSKLKINTTRKITRKIYHYVLFDNEKNTIYDATAKMFNLASVYPFGIFTKNFNNIRLVTNNKYSMEDVLDMLSDRVAVITEIQNLINMQKENYIKNRLTVFTLGSLGSIAGALIASNDEESGFLDHMAKIFVGASVGHMLAGFFNSFRNKSLAFKVMMGDDPELLKRFENVVNKLTENNQINNKKVEELTLDYNKCLNTIFLFEFDSDITITAKKTRKCLLSYVSKLEEL